MLLYTDMISWVWCGTSISNCNADIPLLCVLLEYKESWLLFVYASLISSAFCIPLFYYIIMLLSKDFIFLSQWEHKKVLSINVSYFYELSLWFVFNVIVAVLL